MELRPDVFEQVRQHFCSQYPKEAAGFILKDGSFIPVENFAHNKLDHCDIDSEVYEQYEDDLAAIIHSHTFPGVKRDYRIDARTPSGADITAHISCGVPFGITHCDGENIENFIWLGETLTEPLLEREFIHGHRDCYAACRDWYYQERGLLIPNFARDISWWEDPSKNLYIDNFEKAGFYEIDEADAKVGDAILMRVASRMVNHAGVIVGDGTIFHHLFGQLSTIERYQRYRKGIIKFVRHKDLNNE